MPRHLILIHGALGAASQMAPLADAVRERFETHILELEGHGDTPSPQTQFSIDRFAGQLRELIESKSRAPALVFGYSMGGYVALRLASQQPDLIASIATLGTKLDWSPETAARETSRLDPTTIRAKVPKFADALERRHAHSGGWEHLLARTAELMKGLGANPVLDAASFARITARVRLMVGDRDTVVTVDETARGARALASGELAVLPGTPHPLEQVHGPLLASLLVDFFERGAIA
jgi:pimeloyl-ACP methyl ester carboxylesterase